MSSPFGDIMGGYQPGDITRGVVSSITGWQFEREEVLARRLGARPGARQRQAVISDVEREADQSTNVSDIVASAFLSSWMYDCRSDLPDEVTIAGIDVTHIQFALASDGETDGETDGD